ncbi:MAG: hypothetical protein ACFFBH_15465 [Promethearchaeota archaeon]
MLNINYPPSEILRPIVGKTNFELTILWMLKNNKSCTWSSLKKVVKHSTLSLYLKRLKEQGYIIRVEFNKYQITPKGTLRFNEISKVRKKERILNYPPKAILKARNYEHWILWMVYNNSYCKWVDFTSDGSSVKISQSSLSKALNDLREHNLVEKTENQYRITKFGKAQYSKILQLYDLDKQSILREESKRIEELTTQTLQFFKKFEILDNNIRYRFLYNVLRLPFETFQHNFDNREDFYKILLFLAINHPSHYPEYITSEEFCRKFNVERLILDFHILQIVDKNIYPIKFFKLKVDSDKIYYFQADEKVEQMLNAVIEEQISKFTYLNKLFEKIPNESFKITMESALTAILDETCDTIFNEGFRNALSQLLPGYIKDLAYKIEREKKLIDTYDKLECLIWQEVQMYEKAEVQADVEKVYFINPEFLELLNPLYRSNIEAIVKKVQPFMENKAYLKVLEILDKQIEKEQKSHELIIFKAIVLCYLNRNIDAINLIEKEIVLSRLKQEDTYISVMFIKVINHLVLGNFENASQLCSKLSIKYPNSPLSYVVRGIVYGYNSIYHYKLEIDESENGLADISEYLSYESFNYNKSILYQFKSLILLELKEFEEALRAIDKAIDLSPNILHFYNSKVKIFLYFNKFDEVLKFLDSFIVLFPESEIEIKLKKAYVFKKMREVESGLKIIEELVQNYPDNNELLNYRATWLLYLNQKEQAVEMIKKLIDLEPKKSLFHDTYGEILMTFQEYNEAIIAFQKAIELKPDIWYKFQTYIKLGICFKELKNYDEALEKLQIGKELTNKCYCNQDIKDKWLSIANVFIKEILELEDA